MTKSPRGAGISLMARAVGLLSRREHSRAELDRKLRRHVRPDDDPGELERVLERLQQQNLLSDARFAASLVRQRASRYGDLRIAHDLRQRGVAGSDAAAALTALSGSEPRRALAAWSRRFDALPTSADERGRQGRYLQAPRFLDERDHPGPVRQGPVVRLSRRRSGCADDVRKGLARRSDS